VEETSSKQVHFQKLEAEIAEFVCLKRKIGLSVTCETVKYKTWELAETHITWHYFNVSMGSCEHMMQMNGFSLRRRSLLCQTLPGDFEEKLFSFH
jgi:hypothetical protein